MKKVLLFVMGITLYSISFAQFPGGTYSIPGSYASITAAVTALNGGGGTVSGPVTFNIAAGYTETITATIVITATGTSANRIIFQKSGTGNNPKITAYVGTNTPASAAPDGIIALSGSDYVMFNGIDLLDPNTTNPAAMEFGYGLFKASVTDGCQHDTIINCTITLSRVNNVAGSGPMIEGSVGILAINSTRAAATTNLTITAATGTNSNNVFYSNIIQNCNYGIGLIGFAAASPFTLADTGNDIGGASSTTGNTIKNYGGGNASTTAVTAAVRTLAQYGINVSYNTIINNDGGGVNNTLAIPIKGITLGAATSANATISNNTISIKNGGTTAVVTVIENLSGATSASNTININNNNITGCTNDLATSGAWYGIYNNAASCTTLNMNFNTFTGNTTKATSATYYLIYNSGAVPTTININNNNLAFNHIGTVTAYSGTLYSIYNGSGTTAASVSISNNNFSNYVFSSLIGSGTIYFIYNTNSSANLTINTNTWTNLTLYHSGAEYLIYNSSSTQTALTVNNNSIVTAYTRTAAAGAMYIYYCNSSSLGTSSQTFNGNNFSNITATTAGSGSLYLLYNGDGGSSPYPYKQVYGNTFSNINYNTTGTCYGIYVSYLGQGSASAASAIYNNTINNITTSAGTFYVLYPGTTTSPTYAPSIYGNTVSNFTSNGASGTIYACYLGASTPGLNFYKNNIFNITENGATGYVYGIYTLSSYPYNIYNNYISGLYTPASANSSAINAIYLSSGSTIRFYYNTIYLNASSTGANFGSNAIYASTSPTSIDMINNIIVNNSTPMGTGQNVAYRRSATGLTNYTSTSNYNCFYAGAPGTNRLIFTDGTNNKQTISDYQTFVSARDANSFTELPPFVNVSTLPYNLHLLAPSISQCESGGTPISTPAITTDYDGDTRSGTTPDVGADEGNFVNPYSTLASPIALGGSNVNSSSNNVTFTPNASNNNVLIVWNTTGTFSIPAGTPPSVGSSFAGGTVLNTTSLTSPISHSGLIPGTTYFYMAWSYDILNNYSKPKSVSIATSAIANPATFTAAAASASSITLTFTANANSNNVLIVYNTTGVFTPPTMLTAPPAVNTPFAGGLVACAGSASSLSPQTLSGLIASTTYYFMAYSYDGNPYYSAGLAANATTNAYTVTCGSAIVNYPYLQQFTTWPPACWTLSTSNSSYPWIQGTTGYSTPTNSSPYSARYNVYNAPSGSNATMISPAFDLTGLTSPTLTFKWSHLYSSSYPLDELQVQVSTNSGGSWTVVWDKAGAALSSNDGAGNTTPGAFVAETVDLSSYSTSSTLIKIYGISGYGQDIFVDDVKIFAGAYTILATQTVTSDVNVGTSNNQIIGLQVNVPGTPTLNSITFSTAGSTSAANISSAKVWYTGTTGTFTTTTQYGSTVINPNGSFTVTSPQVLSAGTNYFWLTYNIPCNATNNQYLDAQCNSTVIGSTSYNVFPSDPIGKRRIAGISLISATKLPTCSGSSDGSLVLATSGGTTPYIYNWSTGATAWYLSGLSNGTYTVTVTDFLGCTNVTSFNVYRAPVSETPVITQPLCNGGSNGSIVLTVIGGTYQYSYHWSNGPTTKDISGIPAGSYSVTITDSNSCTMSVSHTVGQPAVITLIPSVHNVTFGGSGDGYINLAATGGTSPYTYLWSTGATTANIINLGYGVYSVTVTDAHQCNTSGSWSILMLNGVKTDATCDTLNNGSINITPYGGATPYTYLWSNGHTTQNISALTDNTYTVTVTDAHGFQITGSWLILDHVVATFTYSTTNGYYYHFVSDLYYAPPGYNITWNFGDGSSVTGSDDVYHTFYEPGVFNVQLTIVSTAASICYDIQTNLVQVSVNAPCDANAAFTHIQSTTNLKTWNFATIIPYLDAQYFIAWDFGDGNTAYGQSVSHTYTSFGNYIVYCYVENLWMAQCNSYATYNIIYGCMDPSSFNYNQAANGNEGNCIAKVFGCTDPAAFNYNPLANTDNNSCIPVIHGCMDPAAYNYNPLANTHVLPQDTCISKVFGCTNPSAFNYNPLANTDNNSCIAVIHGCMDPAAFNYNPSANTHVLPQDTCIPKVFGCTNPAAFNYNPLANTDNNSCIAVIHGCMDPAAFNYNPQANTHVLPQDSCIPAVVGCMNPNAYNYNPLANTPGTCIQKVYGCMDPTASNYNSNANTSDGSCVYNYNMSNTPVTTCQGYFYDSGGPDFNGYYSNNENFTKTFYPSVAGNRIRLTFTSFSTEGGADQMWIYNGINTSAPVILNHWSGLSLPTPADIASSAADGSLTVVFTSNSSGVGLGWAANVICEPKPSTCATATNYGLINSPTVSGTMSSAGDTRWYMVTLDQTYNNVVFSTCPPSGYTSFDTKLEVWDACGAPAYIAYNDNNSVSGCNLQSKITLASLTAGTYYVKIYGNTTGYGNYYLTVSGCPVTPVDFTWSSPSSGLYDFSTTTPFPPALYNVVWTFGDGGSAPNQSVSHTYATSGTYTVTCSATYLANSSCVYTKTYQVTVFACTINVDFTWTNMGSGQYKFQTNGSYASGYYIHWDFGDGGTATGNDIVYHTYAATSYPVVSLYVQDNLHQDCWRNTEHVVPVCNVNSEFTATLIGYSEYQFSLNNAYPSSDYYIDWTFGDGSTANNSTPVITHTYTMTGSFVVSVLVTHKVNWDCYDWSSITVNTYVCTMSSDMTYTNNGYGDYQFALNPAFNLTNYSIDWNFGDGNSGPGTNSMMHTYLTSGTYHVVATVQDLVHLNCVYIIDAYAQIQGCSINPDFTWTFMGSGNVNFTLLGVPNTAMWAIQWNFGDGNIQIGGQTASHHFGAPTAYTVSVYVYRTDLQGCNATAVHSIQIPVAPDWTYINTGQNHTIIIPANVIMNINNNPAAHGDYLGVFYHDSSNNLACGGYVVWNGTNTVLSAWADDPETLNKDGFATGETFIWKIWNIADLHEYTSSAIYMPVGVNGITQQGNFAIDGVSGLLSLNYPGYDEQTIMLAQGWNLMSTYIAPISNAVDQVFAPVISNLILVKDGGGNVYWPFYNINLIGNMTIGKGYQVDMSTANQLQIVGFAVVPETTPISLPANWSILGYLRQSAGDPSVMLASIAGNINIMKNYLGDVYWPLYGVNTIGNMVPGQGYMIKMNSAVTFYYPVNGPAASEKMGSVIYPQHYVCTLNTGNNMTIGVPVSVWTKIPEAGDEIGVFSLDGKLLGSAVCSGNNMAISVWGDDFSTTDIKEGFSNGDPFIIRLWNRTDDAEQALIVNQWTEGSGTFEENGISVIGKFAPLTSASRVSELLQNIPNPFSQKTEIRFYLPESTNVKLEVFNIFGELIDVLISSHYNSGDYSVSFNSDNYSSGAYLYRITTDQFTSTKTMNIIK
ncbi:MAG: PKD domain-containing protein [Bacteroidia bacterium]|nr:PKD domain-containing protein [Bacteroidia bacterium]